MTAGLLADRRAALLPIVAAVGGGVVPALIYLALNPGPTAPGWAVPTATDIAFALGILALLGSGFPWACGSSSQHLRSSTTFSRC